MPAIPRLFTCTTISVAILSVTVQATWHEEMMLFVLLSMLNRPQPQNTQSPLMHDGYSRPEQLSVPIAGLFIMRTPHKLIRMAHLMQQRTDHALKGLRRRFGPRFSEYYARVQHNPALAFLAGTWALADSPRLRLPVVVCVCDVWCPCDDDVVAESAVEEDEVEVGKSFDGEVGAESEAVAGARGGGEEAVNCGAFTGGVRSLGVVLPHYFFGGGSVCEEGAGVADGEFGPVAVEVYVLLSAGVGRSGVLIEWLECLLEELLPELFFRAPFLGTGFRTWVSLVDYVGMCNVGMCTALNGLLAVRRMVV